MTFKLDTSGEVATDYNPLTRYQWNDLSPFTQGYIEALFADAFGHWSDCLPAFSDLARETLARIIADCERFDREWVSNTPIKSHAGHYFWRDRQEGVYRDYPPLTVQLGDGGKVRFA